MKRSAVLMLALALLVATGIVATDIRPAHGATVWTISLDALSSSQVDNGIEPSNVNATFFRVGAIVNASQTFACGTSCISGVFGWQFSINYDPTVVVPQGGPNPAATPGGLLYVDSAQKSVQFGAQSTAGNPNWQGLITAGFGFGGFSVVLNKTDPHRAEAQVFFTLLAVTGAPASVNIGAKNLLANLGFEFLQKPTTSQVLTVSGIKFVNSAGATLPNTIIPGSPATITITNDPPHAFLSAIRVPSGSPGCLSAFCFNFTSAGTFDTDDTIPNLGGYFWDVLGVIQDYGVTGRNLGVVDFGGAAVGNVTLRVQDALGATGSARDSLGGVVLDLQPSHSQIVKLNSADVPATAKFTFTASGRALSFSGATSVDPDGTITSYAWNFGDGTTGTGVAPPAHTYLANGNYTVQLAVTDSGGATSYTSKLINVVKPAVDLPPTVSFTESATTAPTGTPITLTISASDPDGTVSAIKVVWGDGTIDNLAGTATTDSHAYAVAGSYSVYVNATDNAALTTKSAVATKTITDRPPTVSFTESATTAPTGTSITLTISASDPDGTVTAIRVVWGDGTIDNLAGTATTDSHAYAVAGTYSVYVNATDNSGSVTKSTTATKTITDRPPTVSFTESATTGTTATVITLTIASSDPDGTVSSLKVVWGDGTIDTLAGTATTDSHTYTSTGASKTATFTVYVNATDNSGSVTKSSTATKTITDRPPTVSFTESATTGTTATVITLTIASSDPDGTVSSLKVVWGDGTIDTLAGTATTDSHTYTSTGASKTATFTVYVNATDNSGSVTKSSTATKTITDRPPTVSFTESATSVSTGQSIILTITASDPDGTVTSLKVSWGDGTVDTLAGTATTDSHAYSTTGTFAVYVNATDNSGSITKSTVATKTVSPRSVSFSETTTTATTGQSITITISSTAPSGVTVTGYKVSWGDGTVDSLAGTATMDSHAYSSTGNALTAIFTVYVNATYSDGITLKSSTATKTITDRPPTVSFTESATSGTTATVITLTITSADPDGTVSSLKVVWGDGTIDMLAGTATTDSHAYASTGSSLSATFQVYVNATDNSGSTTKSTVATKTITDRPPVAAFTFTPTTPTVGQTVHFDASASTDPDGTITGYTWDFGDTTSGAGVTTSHTYISTGTFTVTLTVLDNSGNSATAKSNVTVVPPSLAGAHASLARWKASPEFHHLSISSRGPTETLRAFGINDGNVTVFVYADFHIVGDTGVNTHLFTQVVQLAPGAMINGKTDPRFSASFNPALGSYTVTATIFFSPSVVQPPIGDPSFKPDLASEKTFSFTVVP